jgi:hypothetical protein
MVSVRCPNAEDFKEDDIVLVYGAFKTFDREISIREGFVRAASESEVSEFRSRLLLGRELAERAGG